MGCVSTPHGYIGSVARMAGYIQRVCPAVDGESCASFAVSFSLLFFGREQLYVSDNHRTLSIMAPTASASMFDQAALLRRQELQGAAGPMAIVRNGKVFGIACFACIGGLVYDMSLPVVCDA
jgi:hypothetical protein